MPSGSRTKKEIMKVLNVLLIGAALFFGTTTVSAQEKTKKTPQERAEMHTTRMANALELTADQRAKVAELNLGVALKNDAIRNDANMSKELKQQSIKGNNDARIAQLKYILNEEQYKKVLEHEAQREAKKEARQENNKKQKAKQKPTDAPEEIEEL